MTSNPHPTLTGSTGDPEGVLAGAVLRLIRTRLGLTQERAADMIGVDLNTIAGWESARRPFARVSYPTMRSARQTYARAGADPALLDQLDQAVDVDLAVGQILDPDTKPGQHPFATQVHNRSWNDLLAWALNGRPPAALRALNGNIPRPRLAVPDRCRLFDSLRTAAEKAANDPAATLLRRQVYFTVGAGDDTAAGRDWLHGMERAELRRIRRGDDWTPGWVAARSIAVARACQGDPDHLRTFIRDHLATDRQEAANLNYWAYWCGEHGRAAYSDEFMAAPDLDGWRGDRLFAHLVAGLHPATPYVELTAHTIWALVARRPWLLDEQPTLAADLARRIDALLASDAIGDRTRHDLDQLAYLTAATRRRR
jgi:transcriptional regulator with XRE-family HTH domain